MPCAEIVILREAAPAADSAAVEKMSLVVDWTKGSK
jgi:hypothetical protein